MKFFKKSKILIVVASFAIGAGTMYSFAPESDNYFEISRNLDIFTSLFRELNIYYVDDVKPGEIMKKGIDEMLESLDPYTNYIPESDIEDFRFMTTGQYGGIGALIGKKGDRILITDPYEGYPAQKNDLRAGDIILEVDGKKVDYKQTDDVSKVLKGQPNTTVKLLIEREGEPKPFEKVLTRAEVKIPSVSYSGMLANDVGYIKLTGFTENAGEEVRNAFVELKEKNKIKSLILDLRGNPGGLLHEAVNIVNIFVDKGTDVVFTKGKVKEWDKEYKALNPPVDTEMPLTVIVNSGSASASEIVSGALQDLDRAIIIGQRSFGKGLVQTTRPISYNAQLKVTTAKYYVPSGRCIQALDYSHRNADGSVGKVPDSLMTEFKTKKGRKVYDGGGIAPDFTTEVEELSNISGSLISKYLIFDYATAYRMKHSSITTAKEFKLTDAEYNEFVTWVKTKTYDYTTRSEKEFEDLKKTAEKEKYYEGLKAEFETMQSKMKHDKEGDLIKFKDEIKQLLESEIASRYYYLKGRVENDFVTDREVNKAIEALNNKAMFDKIMNGELKK